MNELTNKEKMTGSSRLLALVWFFLQIIAANMKLSSRSRNQQGRQQVSRRVRFNRTTTTIEQFDAILRPSASTSESEVAPVAETTDASSVAEMDVSPVASPAPFKGGKKRQRKQKEQMRSAGAPSTPSATPEPKRTSVKTTPRRIRARLVQVIKSPWKKQHASTASARSGAVEIALYDWLVKLAETEPVFSDGWLSIDDCAARINVLVFKESGVVGDFSGQRVKEALTRAQTTKGIHLDQFDCDTKQPFFMYSKSLRVGGAGWKKKTHTVVRANKDGESVCVPKPLDQTLISVYEKADDPIETVQEGRRLFTKTPEKDRSHTTSSTPETQLPEPTQLPIDDGDSVHSPVAARNPPSIPLKCQGGYLNSKDASNFLFCEEDETPTEAFDRYMDLFKTALETEDGWRAIAEGAEENPRQYSSDDIHMIKLKARYLLLGFTEAKKRLDTGKMPQPRWTECFNVAIEVMRGAAEYYLNAGHGETVIKWFRSFKRNNRRFRHTLYTEPRKDGLRSHFLIQNPDILDKIRHFGNKNLTSLSVEYLKVTFTMRF
jgi:hypothetical protein